MRILIGHQRAYEVERICPTSEDGKRVLREHPVSELYIDYFLDGRLNGIEILHWAFSHKVFPSRITLVTNRLHFRDAMGRSILERGYVTNDGINYLKHH